LLGNSIDNCISVPNPGQQNQDGDIFGNACDDNDDDDGCVDLIDNCPLLSALDCADTLPTVPNGCFPDDDSDGIVDVFDNCPGNANPGQEDLESDGLGDACDPDDDGDGVAP
jgi:hypothetical protein